jgi:hypothetical protein
MKRIVTSSTALDVVNILSDLLSKHGQYDSVELIDQLEHCF